MTRKQLSLIIASLFCSTPIFASLSTNLSPVLRGPKDELEKIFASPEAMRSLATENPNNVTFGSAIYNAGNYFLGSNTTDKNEYALSRAYLYTDTTTNVVSARLAGIAPQKVIVNNAKDTENNPIYKASINHISLMNGYPIVALDTPNPSYTAGWNKKLLCYIADGLNGTLISVNTVKLTDTNGAEAGAICGLTANQNSILTAVTPTGLTTFGAAGSGIAIVQLKDSKLSQVGNSVSVLTAASPTPTNITLSDAITMHWDATLNRLFIGLKGKINATGAAFCSGVLVGRLSGDPATLTLEPIVANSVVGTDLSTNKIVAYYQNAGALPYLAIHQLKTMHTSTGKSYLIVNGDIYSTEGATTKTEVYALPIVQQNYSDTTFANDNANQIGKLAKTSSVSQEDIATAISDLYTNLNAPTHIGGGAESAAVNPTPDIVQHMFVIGDAVFVCCAGTTAATRGIFQSTALFNSNGLIRGWTPWQRVMGAADVVYNAQLDANTGNYWYISQETDPRDLIKITQWSDGQQVNSAGEKVDDNLLGNLQTKLIAEFPEENAGIHQMFNFDEQTLGFLVNNFSMMVATGYEKVALIQSGKIDGGVFTPTKDTDFVTPLVDTFVKTYDTSAIQTIGPVCCAEVSRSNTGTNGWLFVGGYNGVAVLCNSTTGAGWNAATGLSNLTTNLAGLTFKTIGSFKNVRKLICDGTNLYVLTPQVLYRVEMSAANFTAPTLTSTVLYQTTSQYLLDFIVSSKLGLLATTNGLLRNANGTNIATLTYAAVNWKEVVTSLDTSLGPVTHLSTISPTKGSFANGGNLYAVAGNMSDDLAAIFRFNIADTSATAITDTTIVSLTEHKQKSTDADRDYFYVIGEIRSAFITDGALGYHTLPKHLGRTDFLRQVPLLPLSTSMRFNDLAIPLITNASSYNVGIPVRNTASGAWVIPGDWGINMNE